MWTPKNWQIKPFLILKKTQHRTTKCVSSLPASRCTHLHLVSCAPHSKETASAHAWWVSATVNKLAFGKRSGLVCEAGRASGGLSGNSHDFTLQQCRLCPHGPCGTEKRFLSTSLPSLSISRGQQATVHICISSLVGRTLRRLRPRTQLKLACWSAATFKKNNSKRSPSSCVSLAATRCFQVDAAEKKVMQNISESDSQLGAQVATAALPVRQAHVLFLPVQEQQPDDQRLASWQS